MNSNNKRIRIKRIGLVTAVTLFYSVVYAQSQSYFPKITPELQGIPSSSIIEFIDRLENEIDAVHSFMIIRHGKLVSQGWWKFGELHSVSSKNTRLWRREPNGSLKIFRMIAVYD